MSKTLRLLFIYSVLVFPLFVSSKEIVIKACNDDAGWPPFSYVNIDKNNYGFSVELLQKIFSNSNYKIKISFMPWSRCLMFTKNGGIDIALDLYFSDERAQYLDYSSDYYQLTSSIYSHKKTKLKNVVINSFNDMKKYRACGRRDFDYGHFMLSEKDFVVLANSYEQIMKLLIAGRCDFFPEESEVLDGLWNISSIKYDKNLFKITRATWVVGPRIYYGISQKSKYRVELLKFINLRIIELKKDQKFYKHLQQKYKLLQ